MTPPFPLTPAPAWLTYARWRDADTKRNGVFEVGDTVTIRLNASGANAYEVRDYYGSVVDSGAVSGTELDLGNAWDPGWYRIYFTGANTDAVFGPAYASTNFTVIRPNANFPDMPPGNEIGHNYGDLLDLGTDTQMRSVMGCGVGRLELPPPTADGFYTVGGDGGTLQSPGTGTWLYKVGVEAEYGQDWWTDSGYLDPARPRFMWVAWSQGAVDRVSLPATGSSSEYIHCFLIDDTRDGAQVFVSLAAGSSSGRKVTVSYPNAGTVVETYDNLASAAAAVAAINAASTYIYASAVGGGGTGTTLSATAIGNICRTGVIGAVQYLYARGVTHYEGPYNEPVFYNAATAADTTHQMKLLSAYVHAGESNAITMGPSSVNIALQDWRYLLEAGFADQVDEISSHDYNSMTNGNLALGRYNIERFLQLLGHYGVASKFRYLTEANSQLCSVYGVYHPRRARFNLLHTLLWEQYGVPRERNVIWYDCSHGYWEVPTFLEHGDTSLNPQPAMMRVLAEETWGQIHDHRIRFGEIADKFLLGSVYVGGDGARTIVLLSTSHMDDLTVTLAVTGDTSLDVVDAFGNVSAISVSGGYAEIPVDDVPTYIRLPVGVEATIYQVNDWGPSPPSSISSKALDMKVGSTFTMVPIDDALNTDYPRGYGTFVSSGTLPENATLIWPSSVDVDRVIVVCGQAWQGNATLVSFDVQTTVNGSDFTTRQTVTKTTPTSFAFGSDAQGTGCSRETYWDEQWIFDVKLPATYTCTGIRIVATAASYGGEPDAAAVTAGGQGNATPRLVLQEIFVPSASLPDTPTVTPKTADFETGTNGATISVGDAGSATAWDAVSGSPTYDNSQAGRGSMSMLLSAGGSEYVSWNLANLTEHYGRFLFRQGETADGYPRIVYFFDAGSALAASMQVASDGNRLILSDTSNASTYLGITSFSLGRWYRVEYHLVHSATVGQFRARVYDDAVDELQETIVSPATWDTGSEAAAVRLGAPSSGGTQTHWLDEIAVGSDAFLGPIPFPAGAELLGMVAI